MKELITFELTKKEEVIIKEFLNIWRDKRFKGGEITIVFHEFEPCEIHYRQQKILIFKKGLDTMS